MVFLPSCCPGVLTVEGAGIDPISLRLKQRTWLELKRLRGIDLLRLATRTAPHHRSLLVAELQFVIERRRPNDADVTAGAAIGLEMPGTTVTGTPASTQAITSSKPRP